MALDGSLNDAASGEPEFRRLRPLTKSQAESLLPLMIYRMKQDALSAQFLSVPDMPELVRLINPRRREEKWVLLRPDFDKAKSVASGVDIRAFRTEPVQSVLDRIRAHVSVEYSGT